MVHFRRISTILMELELIVRQSFKMGLVFLFFADVASGCVYPSSPSAGSSTPTTNPTFGGMPNSSTGNTTGAMPDSTFTPGIGLAPSGTGFGIPYGSSTQLPGVTAAIFMLLSISFALLFSTRI